MTMTSASLLLGFLSMGPSEMMVVVIVAFLLYGGELPKVARQWAKTFGELRRHLSSLQREFNNVVYADPEPVRKLEYYPEFRDAKITEAQLTETQPHPDEPTSFSPQSQDASKKASPASVEATSTRGASSEDERSSSVE